jgi:hypothetical protein
VAAAAAIAAGQHGSVTREQLLAVGVSRSGIGRWLGNGLLHREFRSVYRLGHRAPSVLARYAAAVLAVGGDAALSGLAAARLLELLRSRRVPPPEVTSTRHRRTPGLTIRRARRLEPAHVAIVRGIRCTTPARTLVDIAGVLSLDALARAHHEADVRYGVDADEVLAIIARRPNVRNAANLRSVVLGDTPALLSRLERGFAGLVRERGYPKPVVNRPEGAHWVDCRWAQQRLTVELNSFRFHRSRKAWENDMHREREARRRGDRFRRFTWFDVFEDRTYLFDTLDELLPRR